MVVGRKGTTTARLAVELRGTNQGRKNSFAKIILLNKLARESKTKTIVMTGAELLAAANTTSGLELLKTQTSELSKINSIEITNGKIIVDLKDGEKNAIIKLPKASIFIKDNATVDANGLLVEDVKMTDYTGEPIVKNISGSISISGITAKAWGLSITPETVTFETKIVDDNVTTDGKKALDSYDTSANITVDEALIPNQNDKYVGHQNLPAKKSIKK